MSSDHSGSQKTRMATINFTIPAARLGLPKDSYMTLEPGRERPYESVQVPITDLRSDLEDSVSVEEQLYRRAFAVSRIEYDGLDDIPSLEGTERYLESCRQIIAKVTGCSRIIAWNSTVRRNDPEQVKFKEVEVQKEPEKDFVPTTRLQPIASVAHVDQDADRGRELIELASGRSLDEFDRACIINIWRPLQGPVTNAPLAMCDYRSTTTKDYTPFASPFGTGLDVFPSTSQRWGYIRHQMPNEVIFLKCYDSWQGKDGSALHVPHVAVEVEGEQDGVPEELIRPRESIEVRLVALWDK